MSLFKRWRRWSARLLRVGCLVSAVTVAPGLARCQEGVPADKMLPRRFTKDTSFHLPVQMTPAMRAETRELRLYVKQGDNDWVRVETAPHTATYFTPKVSREGEYWFILQTVSKSGKQSPPDVSKATPGLRVVVDMTAPVIDVQPHAMPDGEFCIRCNVLDPNFDPATLKAVSKTDRGEQPLETVPGMSGTFRVRGADKSFPVRISAADLAKNVATKEVNIQDMVLATMRTGLDEKVNHAAHKVAPPTVRTPSAPPGLVEITPAAPRSDSPAIPGASGPHSTVTLPPSVSPGVRPTPPTSPPPYPAVTGGGTTTPSLPDPIPKGLTEIPPAAADAPLPASVGPNGKAPATASSISDGKFNIARQILNTPQVSIDYRIDQVGPSGVGKVDVYLTADNGQNWKKVKEDMDRRSPLEVELPGEGLYGLKIVITNGNGFGGAPPVRGEQPMCWVEVDATNPHIVLQPIEPITQNGHLEIRWTAGDANIAADPVSLYFRTRAEGPWQAIAKGVKNEGVYRWAFPRDVGGEFWIKAEVVDQAGNVSRVETPMPVVLDMTEPRASVLGISSISVRPTVPAGN